MNLIKHRVFTQLSIIFLISIPFLNFIIANITSLYFGYYIELFKLFFASCLLIFILTVAIFFILKKKKDFNFILFKICLFFFLVFHYKYLVIFFQNFDLNFLNPYYFSLILIIIISFYILLNNKEKFLDFIKIFLTIIFLFTTIQFLSLFFLLDNKTNVKIMNFDTNDYKQESKRNIYYIIVDAATSFPQFQKFYNIPSDFFFNFKNNIKDYKIINETYSSGVKTSVTLFSVLQLDFNEEFYNLDDYQLYPNILRKKTSSNLPLMQLLKKKSYNFYWVTNNFINCSLVDFDKCFIKKKNFFDFYVTTQFLQQSPIYNIIHKIFPNYYGKKWYKKNDAINNFLLNYNEEVINQKNNFFLIHHMMPHEPFVFTKNCHYKYLKTSLKDIEKYKEGYFNSYSCMMKRILEFNQYIKKNDPDAYVLIQGDHGVSENFSSTNYESKIIRKNLTIYKTNDKCNMNNKKIYDSNSEMLRFILKCNFNE